MQKSKTRSTELKASNILVSGSLVYDTIFSLNGTIREQVQIENGLPSKQNLMFTGNAKEIYFGGTGGNIATGLAKLGLKPILVAVAGKDAFLYEEYLKKQGVVLRLKKNQDGFTATFYGLTDKNKEQIGIFQGGVSNTELPSLSLKKLLTQKELLDTKIAIFSPGTAESITKQILEFRKINSKALVVFDPGQMLAIDFTEDTVEKSLRHSNIAIFNDTEFSILKNKFEFNLEKLFSLGLSFVIETKGQDGSVLYSIQNGKIKSNHIKTQKVKKVIDPTGAGDAFRAGLLYGISSGKSMTESMKIASKLGAKCVAKQGGQTYSL